MLEIPRMVIIIIMFGIASYHDVRTREIPDYIWVLGGGAGALLYLFDWNEVDFFVLFSIGIGCMIALLVWKLFPMGDADVLAILAVSIAYPVSFGAVMNPVVVFIGGLLLEHMAALFYNLRYNIEDLIYGRLYKGIRCTTITKIMAFYSVHRRRKHERFTFCAECVDDGARRISLRTPLPDSDYETRPDVFVTWAMPAFPFMTITFLLVVMVFVFTDFY